MFIIVGLGGQNTLNHFCSDLWGLHRVSHIIFLIIGGYGLIVPAVFTEGDFSLITRTGYFNFCRVWFNHSPDQGRVNAFLLKNKEKGWKT